VASPRCKEFNENSLSSDFGIKIEMYWDQYVNQKAALRKVLDSFRLVEA